MGDTMSYLYLFIQAVRPVSHYIILVSDILKTVLQLVTQLLYSMFISNILASFHL